ncbi:MAG: response regulator [Proteobacteria bacterium]|nr:response regulator [Pseudomonadota bacterium]
MGDDKSQHAAFLAAALMGKPASKLSHRDTFGTFSGVVENRDLVETYIPIHGDDGEIDGVFELYTDVTSSVARIERETAEFLAALLASFVLLYAALFLIVRRADRVLKQQYLDLQINKQKIQAKSAALESEVGERIRAEAALIESEARFRDFTEAASDWFWEMDADLRFTHISGRFFWTFRVSPEAVIGRTLKELAGEVEIAADPEKWRRHFDDLEARRTVRDFEYSIVGEDGKVRYLSLNAVPVFDPAGNFSGYRGTDTDVTQRKQAENALREAHDTLEQRVQKRTLELHNANADLQKEITERKQAEESQAKLEQQLIQSQKMDAIGQLTGGIAHDFNNLLMVIDGYSQRAIRSIDDEQVTKKCLERVISASDKAANLTKQLLVFSRQQVMETRVVSPARVLEETLELLQRSVGEQFELALEISHDAISVETDPGQLSQAVMNLVINARDAMPQGGQIVVGLRTTELDEGFAAWHQGLAAGRYAEVYVRDQGVGIDPDTLVHIFEPFFTTKEPGKGTGLGLAMIYGFAQQSGGIVDVSSSPGAGSTFRIYLPLTDRAPEAEVSQVEAAHRGRGEAVLLVEDDEALLDLVSSMLEELGYTVLQAEDGLSAIEIEEHYEERIDLLLSDVVMPNLGGFELATILGETRPDMKVVFMSGYPGRENLRNLKIPEHAAFLQKPVKPDVLAKTIREVLDTDDLRLVS